jgi:hypothetical protein
MGIPSVIFNRKNGGLRAVGASPDGIVGLAYFDDTLNAAFTEDIYTFYTLSEAETAGIIEGDNITGLVHLHLKEAFNYGASKIYVSFNDAADGYNKIFDMQLNANKEMRYVGVYKSTAITASTLDAEVSALHTALTPLDDEVAPLGAIFVPNIYGETVASLPTLATAQYYRVSVLVGQGGPGTAEGDLSATLGASVGALGAVLGVIAVSGVQ